VTYWLDFPPVYDDDLNMKFVRVLKYTPLIFVPSFIGCVIFFGWLNPAGVNLTTGEISKQILKRYLL